MRLTVPERVTRFNYDRMRKIVCTGPDTIGGALYVEKNFNRDRIDLSYANTNSLASQLKYGDVVERMLQDDDLVAFNRQPSLHKMSIMAMRTKIMPAGSVWKMNLSKCLSEYACRNLDTI
tara:strand:- start:492 stop:851 length:360 start_codon:yes stop_codon:yes gene_type:complete